MRSGRFFQKKHKRRMTTIRICEESEARLMIRDGSFMEYVNMWSGRFPQRTLFCHIKELKSKYGFGLHDARLVADAMGAEEDVCFEVGASVLLKKRNDKIDVYRKMGNIWVLKEGALSLFDSEDIFSDDKPVYMTDICDERKIMGVKSAKELVYPIIMKLHSWSCIKDKLFSFGNHEIWKAADNNMISIFSHIPVNRSIFNSEYDIAKHLEEYRAAYKPQFGLF